MMQYRFSGSMLRRLRENSGRSRERLAVAVGRSYQSIFLYEHGVDQGVYAVLPGAPARAERKGCRAAVVVRASYRLA